MSNESEQAEPILAKGRRLALAEITTEWTVWEDVKYPYFVKTYYRNSDGVQLIAFEDIDLDTVRRDARVEGYCASSCCEEELLDWLRARTFEPDLVDDLKACGDCRSFDDRDALEHTFGDNEVCSSCFENYTYCEGCEDNYPASWMTTTLHDEVVCTSCRDNNHRYCSECEGYYHPEACEDGEHDHDSCQTAGCESPAQQFSIRNDGLGPLANDTRVTIHMPGGEMDDEGYYKVVNAIRQWAIANIYCGGAWAEPIEESKLLYHRWYAAADTIEPVGRKWQAKEGNYTKRLSRFFYKTHGLKVPPELVSQIGNIGAQYAKGFDYGIETTRNLNLSAEDFCNEESCWWGGYHAGRCALKTNGGFGIRSFDENDFVAGRVWVLPLRLRDGYSIGDGGAFGPTFDTESPDAFMMFNGYGNLSGYTGARILAHMTGWTYRRVVFGCSPMYVNSDAGYLVAPEEIAEKYTDGAVRMASIPQHSTLFDTEQLARTIETDRAAAEQRETVNV